MGRRSHGLTRLWNRTALGLWGLSCALLQGGHAVGGRGEQGESGDRAAVLVVLT